MSQSCERSDNATTGFEFMTGRSREAERIRRRASALVPLSVPVLILGEQGSGRSYLARAIHHAGGHDSRSLISAGPTDFTPVEATPNERRSYLIREVDRLSLGQQLRWREILKSSEVAASGLPRRVFITCERDLRVEVRSGSFDEEFAERLLQFSLVIPPLRNRRADIADVAVRLCQDAGSRLRGKPGVLTSGAISLLAAQPWPGNVKQLATVVEQLVAFSSNGQITRSAARSVLEDLVEGVHSSRRSQLGRQREELAGLIDEAGGNLAEVARRLGMSRGGVIYRAQKFGLLPSRGR